MGRGALREFPLDWPLGRPSEREGICSGLKNHMVRTLDLRAHIGSWSVSLFDSMSVVLGL